MNSSLGKLTTIAPTADMATVLTAERLNAIQELLKRLVAGENIFTGVGVRKRKLVTGFALVGDPSAYPTNNPKYAFDLRIKPIPDDPTNKKFTVIPGNVNNLCPTNMTNEFTFPTEGITYVWVTATSDGKKITGCVINTGTTIPAGQTPTPLSLPATVSIIIQAIVGGLAYRQIPIGSIPLYGYQTFVTDGTGGTTPPTPAGPGLLPYTPYYVWSMNASLTVAANGIPNQST